MAKKFFYNRVYNTKRTIINAIIIGVCVIGVIICFIITSNFQGESHETNNANLSIKTDVSVEVNEEFSEEIFFSKMENITLDDIEINYDLDYDISKIGEYDVNIIVNEKNYSSVLKVVDTTNPELVTKDVTIEKGTTYTANDFVESCSDNSKEDCIISFFTGLDEDGNSVDYSNYKDEGTYIIRIKAEDASGNQTLKNATLTIGDGNTGTNTPETPVSCKYGDNTYDNETYLLAINITANNCAISLDLYKDSETAADINKLMENETTRIMKDIAKLNLTGTKALDRKVTAVINTSGSGVVGYELKMTVNITNNGKTETVAEYRINEDGKRVFTQNPYKLES